MRRRTKYHIFYLLIYLYFTSYSLVSIRGQEEQVSKYGK